MLSIKASCYYDISCVIVLGRMVGLVIGKADCIEDQIVVNMALVNMGGKYKLVLAT